MKKLKSTLPNMVAVLTGVALVTGGLLAWVHHVTEAPKLAEQQRSLAADISNVMGGTTVKETAVNSFSKVFDGKEYKFTVHDVADQSGQPIGKAVESTTMGFGGDLTVLVGLDNNGRVLGYAIRQTSETPGLGIKAAEWFQKGAKGDIIGMDPTDKGFRVSKDGGDVDGITASTITSRAFLKAVSQAAQAINGTVDSVSGASKRNTGRHTDAPKQ